MNETVKDYRRWDVPHPIPYQGSKRNLASLILSYFPAHISRLVEPFAGSAAISLAAAYRSLADRFLINDAHVPLIDLWHEIINHPERLATGYRRLWQTQLGREFQLICGSCNRAKSWSCEHCANWTDKKQAKICLTCYWANPQSYQHVALRPIRRLDVTWTENETRDYDRIARQAKKAEQSLPEFVKRVLRKAGL